MTRSRYYVALALQSFGLYRKQKRMMDAASELHLLQDGEEILGALCWQNVENIEDLSLEYWQLRKLNRRCDELMAKIKDAEELLDRSHSERTEMNDLSLSGQPELLDELAKLERTKETLTGERNDIIVEATAVKRRYEGLKMKVAVLKEEEKTESTGYLDSKKKLELLRKNFDKLKERRLVVAESLEAHEQELEAHKKRISSSKEGSQGILMETYSLIGRANRDLTKLRAELASENEESSKLHRAIGRYLCGNHSTNSECQQASKEYRQLVVQLILVRESVNLNQKLAERV